MSEKEITAFEHLLDIQKEKMVLGNKSKEITFTSDGSSKTLTICPHSPFVLPDEEIISEMTLPEIGFVVTNYRVWENHFFEVDGISMTHDEYDEVIATNVERRMKSTTSVNRKSSRTKLGVLSTLAIGGMTAPILDHVAGRNIRGLKTVETHKSSSTETEYGDIVFMKDGKRVMVWENFPDPNSTVSLINSAKAHFNTASDVSSSSGGEDPIKVLKLRFVKGEITKEEFLEMKSMLE